VKRFAVVVAAVAVIAVVALTLVGRHQSPSSSPSGGTRSDASYADRFFAGYVNADGQVVRHDQGSDTVSEGQSYAMQIALATGDAQRFATTWTWTKTHLQRGDGLLSWRWADGHVVDQESAADADVDIAVVLVRAADKFHQPGYRDEARTIARAAADHETFTAGGRLLLAAGPWAVGDRIVNPSYLAPCDYGELAAATSDTRWQQLHDGAFAVLRGTLGQGLPPDWLEVEADGTTRPIAGPDDRKGPGRYGLDAARVPARLATCADGQALARQLWPRLRTLDDDGARASYDLDGHRLDRDTNPLGLIAAALSAHVSDDEPDATHLFDRAQAVYADHATYYGAAWLALGDQLLHEPTGHASGTGVGKSVRPVKTGLVKPDQVTPTTAVPPTTVPTTAPSPTTTRPSSTTAPSSTTSPSSSPAATTAVPTTAGGGASDTTAPSDTEPDSSTADSSASAAAEPGAASSGATAGDLIAPRSGLDQLLPGRNQAEVSPQSPAERSRRRTGAITIGGFAGVGALGASLGLRERRLTRRRLSA
jgi:endoglucanase